MNAKPETLYLYPSRCVRPSLCIRRRQPERLKKPNKAGIILVYPTVPNLKLSELGANPNLWNIMLVEMPDGRLNLPGGNIEELEPGRHETPYACAMREAKEELMWDCNVVEPMNYEDKETMGLDIYYSTKMNRYSMRVFLFVGLKRTAENIINKFDKSKTREVSGIQCVPISEVLRQLGEYKNRDYKEAPRPGRRAICSRALIAVETLLGEYKYI